MIKILFVMAVCGMFAPLAVHIVVVGATWREKWGKVRKHWLAALALYVGVVFLAVAQDKPPPPPPPPPVEGVNDRGEIKLYWEDETGRLIPLIEVRDER